MNTYKGGEKMLVKNQVVKMTWSTRNKKIYTQKGYEFTDFGDVFYIKIEDLSNGSHTRVKVKCDYCGETVTVEWRDYLKYKDEKYACKRCRQKKTSEKNLFKRQEYLYNSALEFCNSKGYTLITKKEDIKDSNTRAYYECPKHGIHNSKIYSLLLGFGCPECAYEENGVKSRLAIEQVNEEISRYGGTWINKEDYKGWNAKNLQILCPICGELFITSFNSFIKHGGQFCPECSKCKSKGEKSISMYLENKGIMFIAQHRFDECKDKYPLPFDFYLPDLNVCIEFNGIQHYKPVGYFGGNITFIRQKKHDDIKNNYCANNKIKLIIIPYWDFPNIESILNKELLISHKDIV